MKDKKYDYRIARALVKITTILFITQVVTEIIATRNQQFYWVLPVITLLLCASLMYSVALVVLNAINKNNGV